MDKSKLKHKEKIEFVASDGNQTMIVNFTIPLIVKILEFIIAETIKSNLIFSS